MSVVKRYPILPLRNALKIGTPRSLKPPIKSTRDETTSPALLRERILFETRKWIISGIIGSNTKAFARPSKKYPLATNYTLFGNAKISLGPHSMSATTSISNPQKITTVLFPFARMRMHTREPRSTAAGRIPTKRAIYESSTPKSVKWAARIAA